MRARHRTEHDTINSRFLLLLSTTVSDSHHNRRKSTERTVSPRSSLGTAVVPMASIKKQNLEGGRKKWIKKNLVLSFQRMGILLKIIVSMCSLYFSVICADVSN